MEALVAEHQEGYYAALGVAQKEADCTKFIEFMLQVILQTIEEVDVEQINEPIYEQINERQRDVISFLRGNSGATIGDIAEAVGASVATVRRDLGHLRDLNVLIREGSRKSGHWKVIG